MDFGNTRAKYALFDADGRLLNLHHAPIGEALHLPFEQKIDKAIFSTVSIPEQDIADFLTQNHIPFIALTPLTPLPYTNRYASPSLGNDRRAIAAAAVQLFEQKNVLVICAGTCITYNLVDTQKQFLGGAISLGLTMRYHALHHYTQKLPLASHSPHTPLVATTTLQNLQSGVENGILFEMQGYIAALNTQYPNLETVLTGGDAHLFANQLTQNTTLMPHFLLMGLYFILKHNL